MPPQKKGIGKHKKQWNEESPAANNVYKK